MPLELGFVLEWRGAGAANILIVWVYIELRSFSRAPYSAI
jgi:hypothetical protein